MQDVAHWAIMCGAGLATAVASYLAATRTTFDLEIIGMGWNTWPRFFYLGRGADNTQHLTCGA